MVKVRGKRWRKVNGQSARKKRGGNRAQTKFKWKTPVENMEEKSGRD